MLGYYTDDLMLNREQRREDPSCWQNESPWGIVTTAHYKATEAGAEVLSGSGNAVDAAVAASLALGVVEPAGSGLGGMTMMMIHLAEQKKTFILEGPCRAPQTATPEKLLALAEEYKKSHPAKAAKHTDEEIAGLIRRSGYHAVAVPTNPAVLGYALKKYGTFTPAQVTEPAAGIAEQGYRITPFQNWLLKEYRFQIRKGNASQFLFNGGDTPPAPGTLVRQPALADTLRILGKAGFEDFYTGRIGRSILADMAANNGFITETDFDDIPWPVERQPLVAPFHDWTVYCMPPPGGGVVLIEMLNLFVEMARRDFDPDSPEAALLFAAIIGRARLDRRKYNLGEVTRSGEKAPDLTSREYARKTAAELRQELSGSGETSHLNVIDRFGNIVALTQSIERFYGAKVATPELGFLYNGFVKGFKLKNKRHPHFLRPGAVTRSNACPTIIFHQGVPKYAIGSTGSERLASGMFQVLVRLRSQPHFTAVAAPRLHCTPERQVFLEAGRFNPRVLELLQNHKFTITPCADWEFSLGGLHLAGKDRDKCWGVAEPRRDGSALGPESEPSRH